MIVLDQVMQISLAASNAPLLLPVFLIGFFLISTKLYGRALCVLMFSTVYSQLLKQIFIILIPSSVGPGHVFPSGHMCASTIFYGWLLLYTSNKYVQLFLVVLLFGIGSALVYYGYHNWIDICGGLLFGMIVIIFVAFVIHKVDIFEKWPYIIGYFLLFFVILMLILHYFLAKITSMQLVGMCTLIAFPVFWMFYDTLITTIIVYKTLSEMHALIV